MKRKQGKYIAQNTRALSTREKIQHKIPESVPHAENYNKKHQSVFHKRNYITQNTRAYCTHKKYNKNTRARYTRKNI